MNSFYSRDELISLGFSKIGENVLISKKSSIYGANNIAIGNNVRIDDFCILSGKIDIGDYIHISAYTGLFAGSEGIEIKDFATISSRCCLYAISDDYSGVTMTNPMISDEYRKIYGGKVVINKHAIIGSGCTVLPNVDIGEGAAVGAMSLVTKDLEAWNIFAGIPVRKLKERKKDILSLEQQMISDSQKEKNDD